MSGALRVALGGTLFVVQGLWLAAAVAASARPAGDDKPKAAVKPSADDAARNPPQLAWHTDYAEAVNAARAEHRMLLIHFCDPGDEPSDARFEKEVLAAPDIAEKLQPYVLARLPLDAKVTSGGEEIELLGHRSFRHMLGRRGIAILDYTDEESETHGLVVSAFPFAAGKSYSKEQVEVIVGLPQGTLTQRTLIYAVRMHPEKPASTNGEMYPFLAREAESHAAYQARIRLQGHHTWETRFHRINRLLPRGLLASEVCAESWPGETLVEAAVECVRCWRHSSGHWSAVRARHPVYAYDMKLGSNGIWYACGIFGKGRLARATKTEPGVASP